MNEDLDLRTIRAFVAVADAGDFTAAARTLHMHRSAVGKALVRLEAKLGVRLLHRTTRRVSMTSDGAVFHRHCVRLLAELADAENAVRRQRQEPRGTLKVTLPDAYGRRRILPILQEYMRRWPDVGVEVSFTDRIVDIVEEGLDLAIRIGDAGAGAGLVTRTFDRIGGVLCASPGYLDARGVPADPEALGGHDLLRFGERGRIRPWPVAIAAPRSSRGPARLVTDSAEAQRMLVLAGFGIAHLPDFLVASDLEAGTLVAIPGESVETIDVRVLYPERSLLPARARLFVDMVVEALRMPVHAPAGVA